MAIEFESAELEELTPKIAVFGVGGAGCNAVHNMIKADLRGVDFVIANTDAQSLMSVPADTRIQLGAEITQGLGAGAQPKIGEAAAEESMDTIDKILDGCHMAFVTAGMGGGTGTGASPVIARRAREKGILTVGVVTKPFMFEGSRRMKIADAGIKALAENVDTLIIIPNQNLFNVANERTTFAEAFKMADEVLHSGVRSITDLMVVPGMVNLDFADVRTVMSEMGKAMMGTGEAEGEDRARLAAEAAISNQLLEDASLKGAKGVIINVTGSTDLSLYEVDTAVNMVRELADEDALIVFGSAMNSELDGRVRVSVVATGIEGGPAPKLQMARTHAPKPATPEVTPAPAPAKPVEADLELVETASVEAPATTETAEPVTETPVETTAEVAEQEAAPMDDMISAVEALEKKALERSATRSFVADAPINVSHDAEQMGSANVFAEADYANSSTGDEAAEQAAAPVAEEAAPEPVKAPNLFQKVTRRFSGNQPSAAPAPAEAPSPSLGGVSADDRPAPAPRKGTDQMEIPAFLKRQQN